jgi:SAM-dependent methyltransferase
VRELAPVDALALYEGALLGNPEGAGSLHAVGEDGSRRRLPIGRWLGTPDAVEETVLARAVGPVLDVGCGAGRHVVALGARGVRAVGIEISGVAVAIARERGAEVIEGSIFTAVTTTAWETALLLDGNIGIGGDATCLLRRAASLLAPRGRVLVELEPPTGAPGRRRVRLEGKGGVSHWMPWDFVGVGEVDAVAAGAGLLVEERWSAEGRWFAQLRPREPACRASA